MRKATKNEIDIYFPKPKPSVKWRERQRKKGLDPDAELEKMKKVTEAAIEEQDGKIKVINITGLKEKKVKDKKVKELLDKFKKL